MGTKHKWISLRGNINAQRCTNPWCEVRRYKVPVLGDVYSVMWGHLSTERYKCPTSIADMDAKTTNPAPESSP